MSETIQGTIASIAILDDDADFRTYLEDFLSDESNYSVRAFGNTRDLYESCEESLPDIVLLDMKMGDASGDKVLEQLISRWPGLCVIIITGYPSLEDMRTTFKLKVFDYLAKPFSLTQLRQVLKNAVDAFGHAGRLKPGDVEISIQEVEAMLDNRKPDDAIPARAVALLKQVEAVSPERPEVLWYLGLIAARNGQRDEAEHDWQRLLLLLPANGNDRKLVAEALQALDKP